MIIIIIITMQIPRFLDHCLITASHSALGLKAKQIKAGSQKSTFTIQNTNFEGNVACLKREKKREKREEEVRREKKCLKFQKVAAAAAADL